MKSQGGVRSVVMCGRPQTGPVQGVAGSKGSEVLTFSQIDSYLTQIPQTISNISLNALPIPSTPPTASIPLPMVADSVLNEASTS
ncbi:uncharacterized protein EAF01_010718 [Botrytis porri]|uniref:uncharacterized protein n=1 Tax=Botrytis porri TaxID=87229 RepID=UPI0018FF1425|nr:uncharacterized protein EAF01_010718 [Botrytis porri]KAF7890909.1 hypothetical protein EAF01_010718 [Botrytis porri]